MGIESNKEAMQMVKNTLGSLENRMREAYNKGYKDGIKEGINQAMQKIADSILEEVEADRKDEPQTERPRRDAAYIMDCIALDKKIAEAVKRNKEEQQTDCQWK